MIGNSLFLHVLSVSVMAGLGTWIGGYWGGLAGILFVQLVALVQHYMAEQEKLQDLLVKQEESSK